MNYEKCIKKYGKEVITSVCEELAINKKHCISAEFEKKCNSIQQKLNNEGRDREGVH